MTTHYKDKTMHELSGKKIIVCGAGVAGLAFVIALKRLWLDSMGTFPLIVQYEREHGRPDLSREGYSVSIRSGGDSLGMQALQAMNILDKVVEAGILRQSDTAPHLGLWTASWNGFVSKYHPALSGLPRSPLRIARSSLRMVLLDASKQKSRINWGVACTSMSVNEDGRICVDLSTGAQDTCDILIAADGANSKLRACTPYEKLSFAGPVSISAVSRFQGRPPAPVDKAWGLIPSGQGVSLFVSPMGDHEVNWCISYLANQPRSEIRPPMSQDLSDEILEEARHRGASFQHPFNTLVNHSDRATLMVFNAMDRQPFSHTQINGIPRGVVFIGDSNHAVSAFAANGANLALIDGYTLAESLCAHASFDDAIEVYDRRSIPRASRTVEHSHHHISLVHSEGLEWALHYLSLRAYAVWIYLQNIMFYLISRVWQMETASTAKLGT